MSSKNNWIPEICYEEVSDGLTSNIPFIDVPTSQTMPKILFIFESRDTGEHEPGPDGEPLPITDLDLHQYADMNTLRDNLDVNTYDIVRQALGLEPLSIAVPAGEKITTNIKKSLT